MCVHVDDQAKQLLLAVRRPAHSLCPLACAKALGVIGAFTESVIRFGYLLFRIWYLQLICVEVSA
jgi:hypothetical protein